MERADVIARLESLRDTNELADLAFYAYRDLNRTEAEPFLKAALERCPVSIAGCAGLSDDAVVATVAALPDESIYDEPGRLAQPDEVWNYGRGDGVEKALLLANILRARHPEAARPGATSPRTAPNCTRGPRRPLFQRKRAAGADLGLPSCEGERALEAERQAAGLRPPAA